jgi:peroxiredoxin Q/BCP
MWGGGSERSTFVIHQGRIAKMFRKVKVDGHTEEVLKALRSLPA